jgi:hypothetical protein
VQLSLLCSLHITTTVVLSAPNAIMKGVTVAGVGAPYVVVDDLEKPVPGPGQVLVKSFFSGLNPVETFMQSSGVMVTSW